SLWTVPSASAKCGTPPRKTAATQWPSRSSGATVGIVSDHNSRSSQQCRSGQDVSRPGCFKAGRRTTDCRPASPSAGGIRRSGCLAGFETALDAFGIKLATDEDKSALVLFTVSPGALVVAFDDHVDAL